MASDRIFGLVVMVVALAYVASATQIQTSFLSDPVGPKTFPILVGCIAALCGLVIFVRPDPSPDWPAAKSFAALGIAVLVLVGYAYTLQPGGFIVPTALASGILSYQITPRVKQAVFIGLGMSVGLFLIFKYVLDLGLYAFPRGLFGG